MEEILKKRERRRVYSPAVYISATIVASCIALIAALPQIAAQTNYSTGIITTIAGNGPSGFSGDNAFNVKLNHPAGVAVDTAGNVFIADGNNHRIRKLTPQNVISTVAGNGSAGGHGDGGLAVAAELNTPQGVAIDAQGNLIIADTGDNRIRKVDSAGVITNVAGTGDAGFSGDTGQATLAKLDHPNGVAVDSSGNIYIADTGNNRIRIVNSAGVISTLAGNGTAGYGGDGGAAIAAALAVPAGVAADNLGNVFVADLFNHRIRRITGGIITTFAGNGTGGYGGDGGAATTAQLAFPFNVSLDANGNLYIADYLNERVRKVTGGVINTVAGNGSSGFSGDGGPAASAGLSGPTATATDTQGNLYIAEFDGNRVRKVNSSQIITTAAGTGVAGYNGEGKPANFAELDHPYDVAANAAGDVFVVDNGRIRRVNAAGVITTIAGTGQSGFGGDGGPASAALLNDPKGVATDAFGNLFIADRGNHRIRKISPNGVITTIAGNGQAGVSGDGALAINASLNGPIAVSPGPGGTLYISDFNNHRIRKIDSTGVITTIAGGSASACDTGSPSHLRPLGLATDSSGNVFFATLNLVCKITPGGVLSIVAGTGSFGFDGDGNLATAAKVEPADVAIDADGNLLIAHAQASRIRMVDSGGIITTIAGDGGVSFSGDGGPAAAASIGFVYGFALDPNGSLLIAAFDQNRVRRITFGTPSQGAPLVSGISPFTGDQGTAVDAVITGANLGGATTVSFSGTGVTATIGSGATSTTLPVTINIASTAAAGFRTFTVNASAGASAPFTGFNVAGPAITGISPSSINVGTSISATISGTALTGATAVTFTGSGLSAAVEPGGTATSLPITITATLDAAPGHRGVTVTTPGGTSTAFAFSVTTATITGMTPVLGTTGMSFQGFITGTNLGGASTLTFSGSGVTGVISPGATSTRVPFVATVAPNATLDQREATLTVAGPVLVSFMGYTVVAPDPSGVITTIAGDGSTTFSGAGGPAFLAGLPASLDIAMDSAGTLFIADRSHRIFKIAADGVLVVVAGTGTPGYSGDNGPATAAEFRFPSGIAVDALGNVFIADRDNNRVRKIAASTGVITTVAGSGPGGFSGDNGPATLAQLDGPEGIAFDASGNFFIADGHNHRIRKVAANGIITTVAGNGTAGFGGDGGQATAANLNNPLGVAADSAGNIFVADRGNHRIRRIAPNGIITTFAGTGDAGWCCDNGPATSAMLSVPRDIAVDASGNVFIADTGTRRIRKVASTGIITTVAGNFLSAFAGDGGPATSASLSAPTDILIDADGNLILADQDHHRIRKVEYRKARRGRSQLISD